MIDMVKMINATLVALNVRKKDTYWFNYASI